MNIKSILYNLLQHVFTELPCGSEILRAQLEPNVIMVAVCVNLISVLRLLRELCIRDTRKLEIRA